MSSGKTASSPIVWLLLVVVVYALMSVAIAVSTSSKCGRLDETKDWQWFPPAWECRSYIRS